MIDIDYILGKSKKKGKPKAFDLFAGTPTRKQSDPFKQLFQGQGHPIVGDRVTPAQRKKFVKAKRLRDPMVLFTDHDKDGVISGLDCAPRNPKKHMAKWHPVEEKDKITHYIYDTPVTQFPSHSRYKYKQIPVEKLSRTEKYHSPEKIDEIKSSGEIREPITVKNIRTPLDYYDQDRWSDEESGSQINVPYKGETGTKKIQLFSRGGHYEIQDGHHRAIAAAERGDSHIIAKVYDDPDRYAKDKEYAKRPPVYATRDEDD